MEDIFEIIDSYRETDFNYYNDLYSIIQMLNYEDLSEFGKLLKKAESKTKKISVKIDNKEQWDSLMLSNLIIK